MFYASKLGMNAPTKLLLALTAAVALSFAHPASANLIVNGGFETGDFTGWTNNNIYVDHFVVHSGNFAARFHDSQLSQTIATTPGAHYTIDFWLAQNSSGGGVTSFVANWNGSTIFSTNIQGVFGYTEYMFNVTASTSSSMLQFVGSETYGAFYLDDVSVNQRAGVPDTGSTVSLLGCALLGLAALRRKLRC